MNKQLAFLTFLLFLPSLTPAQRQPATRVNSGQAAASCPTVVGHRGLLKHAQENTLANFAACVELRIGFEFDIRRSTVTMGTPASISRRPKPIDSDS